MAQFQAAAEMFSSAASQVASLAIHVDRSNAADALRGGSLARQVPAGIAAASATALACKASIERAEQTCRERAAVIAEYLVRLEAYDAANARFNQAHARWYASYREWWNDPYSTYHPGAEPRPPVPPVPPPDWATVRRP